MVELFFPLSSVVWNRDRIQNIWLPMCTWNWIILPHFIRLEKRIKHQKERIFLMLLKRLYCHNCTLSLVNCFYGLIKSAGQKLDIKNNSWCPRMTMLAASTPSSVEPPCRLLQAWCNARATLMWSVSTGFQSLSWKMGSEKRWYFCPGSNIHAGCQVFYNWVFWHPQNVFTWLGTSWVSEVTWFPLTPCPTAVVHPLLEGQS